MWLIGVGCALSEGSGCEDDPDFPRLVPVGSSTEHRRALGGPADAAELVRQHPEPTAHFASELVAHLYDEEAALPMVSVWLDRSLGAPMVEVVQHEHRRQVVQQTSLANVIGSCRRLMQIQWQELFEAVSRVDVELAKDPAAIYPRVDFETRNRYRDAVEEIARWSKTSELEIIGQALALACAAADEIARHVGYHLIDAGRPAALESARFRMAEVSTLFVSVCHRPTLKEYHDTPLILKHDGTSMCLLATSLRSAPRRKVSRFPLSSASAALHPAHLLPSTTHANFSALISTDSRERSSPTDPRFPADHPAHVERPPDPFAWLASVTVSGRERIH